MFKFKCGDIVYLNKEIAIIDKYDYFGHYLITMIVNDYGKEFIQRSFNKILFEYSWKLLDNDKVIKVLYG